MSDGGEEERRTPRFPTLDPEPPGRRRPPAWVGIVLVLVVALVVLAVVFVPGRGPGAHSKAANSKEVSTSAPKPVALGGRIVAFTGSDEIELSDPKGGHRAVLPGLTVPNNLYPVVAPDARDLAVGRAVYAVHGLTLTAVASPLTKALARSSVVGGFADVDAAAVVVPEDTSGNDSSAGEISVMSFNGTRSMALGVGDAVAGDPRGFGVFVSTVVPGSPPSTDGESLPDRDVELRDAGHPTVVLATDTQLDADVGLATSVPVSLKILPDPTGDELAVSVVATDQSVGGIVVLDRGGRVLGILDVTRHVSVETRPAWSPDGRSLAYVSSDNDVSHLGEWTIGGPVLDRAVTNPAETIGNCAWAPDASTLLCAAYTNNPEPAWLIFDARKGPPISEPGLGVPLAWIS